MTFQKDYPFSPKFKDAIFIALVAGLLIAVIHVFLQPFDTFQSKSNFKSLKLTGYGLTSFFAYIIVFIMQNGWFTIRKYRWKLWDEIFVLSIFFLCNLFIAMLYHHYVFEGPELSFSYFTNFLIEFGIPFAPILLPLIAYLRYTKGTYYFKHPTDKKEKFIIRNQSGSEEMTIFSPEFIAAEAQQNYVTVYHLDGEVLEQKMIRITMSELENQIKNAQRIHRSYLVNLDLITDIQGNKRKAQVSLKHLEKPIPVSQKHYDSLKKLLQIQPK